MIKNIVKAIFGKKLSDAESIYYDFNNELNE